MVPQRRARESLLRNKKGINSCGYRIRSAPVPSLKKFKWLHHLPGFKRVDQWFAAIGAVFLEYIHADHVLRFIER